MSKLIAVQGMTLILSDKSDPTISAVIAPTGIPDLKAKIGGLGICKNGFSLTVSGIVTATATIPDPVTYTANLQATAIKSGINGTKVLRVDDKTLIISAVPQIPPVPPNPSPTPYPVTFTVKISVAGQIKAETD